MRDENPTSDSVDRSSVNTWKPTRHRAHVTCWLCAAFFVIATAFDSPVRAQHDSPVYELEILPLLSRKCGQCHDDISQEGGLDLLTIEGVRNGGDSGEPAIGDSLDESAIWNMIDLGDMPPQGEPPLTEDEFALLKTWIERGGPSKTSSGDGHPAYHQHNVIPIVLLRCVTCHGPQRTDGGLDLRTRDSMIAGGHSGPAMVPGDANSSLMIQRIESQACPPRELLLKFFVKRPPESEVDILRQWIDDGAMEIAIEPNIATTEPDLFVTDLDRQHWAFQRPHVTTDHQSIDEFLEAELARHGMTFEEEADRDTLIRRAYIDLIGLPPDVNQWHRWRDSPDEDWYSQMIDELLASPRYGERWGRYWLDVAGYADSEGGISADPMREVAWKYRDYVIRSLNEDKPYDRFLLEQIAGDELLDVEEAEVVTREMVDNLIATGFLRMGVDQTGSRTMNFVPERLGVIDDAINVLSQSLMGLTLSCARCHSHKYDPIPQRDYYRFKAVLQGALDEHDWLTFKDRSLQFDVAERIERVRQNNPALESQLRELEREHKQAIENWQTQLLQQHYPDQSDEDRDETIRALRIADNNRTQPQRILVELLQKVEVIPSQDQPPAVQEALDAIAVLTTEIRNTRWAMEPSLEIRALWDRGDPSPTYVLRRGEHNRPGELVGPGVPSVLTDGKTPFAVVPPFPGGTPKTGRRLALAKWMTRADHPLTARVMVNRIWFHHFGSGLVPTLDNFGIQGARPTHPELLDWLAIEFIESGWSIKDMHRRMMNSKAYRQSSRVSDAKREQDPENRLISRMNLRRLDAEALRDSLLFVSGRLDDNGGGLPDPIEVDRDGLISVIPTKDGMWRRSVYLQFRRTEIPTMLDTFDYPEMGPNCVSRDVSTVSPQSLLMLNNQHVHDLAVALARRVEHWLAEQDDVSPESTIECLYAIALSREPSQDELRIGVLMLDELRQRWHGDEARALETFCHTVLNSAAFLYVD